MQEKTRDAPAGQFDISADLRPFSVKVTVRGLERLAYRRCVRRGALGDVVDASSYATLSLAGGFLVVLLLPAVTWYRPGRPRPA